MPEFKTTSGDKVCGWTKKNSQLPTLFDQAEFYSNKCCYDHERCGEKDHHNTKSGQLSPWSILNKEENLYSGHRQTWEDSSR